MDKEKTLSEKGHRERVREQILLRGITDMPPHQVLEYLLFPFIPYKDTKPIAYTLLNKFGNISQVLQASTEALLEVKGVTLNGALFLHTLPQVFSVFEQQKLIKQSIHNAEEVIPFLRRIAPNGSEAVFLIFIDVTNKVSAVEQVKCQEGGSIMLDTTDVINAVMRNRAPKLIIAHNHPSLAVSPSQNDLMATRALQCMLSSLKTNLIDHVIVGKEIYYSMHAGKMFSIET